MAKASTPASVMVGGVEYVPKGSEEPKNSNVKIVVLQRGWVVVGRFSQDGDMCHLDDASVVRIWGTTRGLGQLAKEGPTSSTRLDKTNAQVTFHILTTVLMVDCVEAIWNDQL